MICCFCYFFLPSNSERNTSSLYGWQILMKKGMLIFISIGVLVSVFTANMVSEHGVGEDIASALDSLSNNRK